MIRVEAGACSDFERAQRLEWLETNGLGGFASSTITGLNTRRYHGLLIAAVKPPVGRMVLLSKLDETLIVNGKRFDLATNRYPGAVYPEGHRYLVDFRLDPFPTFVFRVAGVEIEKRVFMVHGENTTVVEYELRSGDGVNCTLEIRPLIAFRDYHAATHANASLDAGIRQEAGRIDVEPYAGLPPLHFAHNAAEVGSTGDWYYNFEYSMEQERGLDAHEDLFQPFLLRYELRAGETATVIASLGTHDASEAPELRQREIARREQIIRQSASTDPLVQRLTTAADAYVVRRDEAHTIIAGYHWFADWGRDTMIALPGLTLATGRWDAAKNILQTFAGFIDRGMLPNRFPDAGEEPEYNTVDATLWFFEAVRSYVAYTGDLAFVREHLYAKLKQIVNCHLAGTRYGIRADDDGLLRCGEPGVQLTWMDAKIGDWVVTPRYGKPVEIQALWYNALRVLAELAREFDDPGPAAFLSRVADEARASFRTKFWNAETECLFDTVDGDHRDGAIRPNQIFAVSLYHRMLSPDQETQVVDVVERELLTPMGLRSLSPHEAGYRARYEGGVYERDSAYHQGTVWPWLMGPFVTAYLKTHPGDLPAKARAFDWLRGLEEFLITDGLGQLPEIADAEAPHRARGCFAQAWSVGELLRAAVEDVYELRVFQRSEVSAATV